MNVLARMYRGDNEFAFTANSRRWLIISGTLLVVSLASLFILRLNLSVEFEGGTTVEIENFDGASVEEMRSAVAGIGEGNARVQLLGDGARVLVQTEELPEADLNALVAAVVAAVGGELADASVQSVGPTFGADVTRRAIQALVTFLLVVVAFISFRFEWKMALAAIAALVHDLIITAGIYSLVAFEVTPATVIAILTILGYSLYDTVVVFDKVTENVEDFGDRMTFSEIADRSLNQVLMRSINTSLTSLLPVGSLLFVGSFILGASTLREFALALFIGLSISTYSSIFVATPLLTAWKEREMEWQRMQRRVARRAGSKTDPLPAMERVPAFDTGATARPPKRRRR